MLATEKQVDEPEAEKAVQSRLLQSFITPKLSGTLMACIIHDHYRHYFRERIRNLKMCLTTQCEQTKYWLNSSYMLISTNSV